MIVLGPDDPAYFVGVLPAIRSHPLLQEPRRVHLTYEQYLHILERRTSIDEAPATFVLRHLSTVVATPTHVGLLKPAPSNVDIFAYVPQDVSSGVCVSLKCLAGETWINTAFPMGMRTLLKHLRKQRLRPIEENFLDGLG